MMMLPHSLEIEQSVLFSLITSNDLLSDHIMDFQSDDFYFENNKLIFNGIKHLYKNKVPMDFLVIYDKINDFKLKEYLKQFMCEEVFMTANFNGHKKLLKDYSIKRNIIKVANNLIEIANNDNDPIDAQTLKDKALNEFEIIGDIKRQETGEDVQSVLLRWSEEFDKRCNSTDEQKTKMFTGIADLDRYTSGLHPGELTVIAAFPAVGKTALAIQIAECLSKKGNKVYFVTREMTKEQLVERLMVRNSEVNGQKIRKGQVEDKDTGDIARAYGIVGSLGIKLDSTTSTVTELKRTVKQLKRKGQVDALFIDYLQLLESGTKESSRELEIGRISGILKGMSTELQIPVVTLSQLNEDGRLRESKKIEQDADNILIIDKPKEDAPDQNLYSISITKQRNGPIGKIQIYYRPDILKFFNYGSVNF